MIRKRNGVTCSSMLRREEEGITVFSSECERNNKIRRVNRATSPSPISTLPDELVMVILSRLPPKPFFRCRTVCKSWLSLSTDALGLNEHLRPTLCGIFYNNRSRFRVGFVNLTHGADKVEVDRMVCALSSYHFVNVIDCCNGLLLIKASSMNSPDVYNLYVYNPVTWTLHNVGSFSEPLGFRTFSLAFDPRVYSQFHIICFEFDDKEIFSSIDIFSFESGKYISRKELACDTMIKNYIRGTFVEGRVHRITARGEILSINANECSYQVINPRPDMKNRTSDQIGQSQGLLHYMSLCEKKGLLFIWVLKSYTRQEWTLKHQLSLDKIYSVLQPHCDISRICYRILFMGHFAFHPEKEILFMPVGCDDDLMSLDLSTGKRKELVNMGKNKIATGPWIYVPCYLV